MAAMALLAQPCFEEDSKSLALLPLQVLYGVRVQVLYLSSLPRIEAEIRAAFVLLNCQYRLDNSFLFRWL